MAVLLFVSSQLLAKTTYRKPAPADTAAVTMVKGIVTDATTKQPLQFVNIRFDGLGSGTASDIDGKFQLLAKGQFSRVIFSRVGYQTKLEKIKSGSSNQLVVHLVRNRTALNEVSVSAKRNKKYRNKGNPAVELIQQVIDHKPENRALSSPYLDYEQYERLILSAYDLPGALTKRSFFNNYKFLIDSTLEVDGKKKAAIPIYFNEKLSHQYFRQKPEKTVQVVQAENGINMFKFVDTAGVGIYMKRLYGNEIDLYENNIFIINRQFLSPIADHAPNYYKFFIVDTIQTEQGKLVELAFTPRNRGDLLFEGKLQVTLDGHYAVAGCDLGVNKDINMNFMRNMMISLDFEADSARRYRLTKSDVKAEFIAIKNQLSMHGQRTVVYTDYRANTAMPDTFYRGSAVRQAPRPPAQDTAYWRLHRTDTLTGEQKSVYAKLNRLQNMKLFKTMTWIAGVLYNDYANLGKVQYGPVSQTVTYDSFEGVRFQAGGRTTSELNKTIYADGYLAYGTRDKQVMYNAGLYYSLNKIAPFRFPNSYFKFNIVHDVDLPGENLFAINPQAVLSSFQTGKTDYWLDNRITSFAYVKDFENHFSFNVALKNWQQRADGTLVFRRNDADQTIVNTLSTTEADLNLRWAPHEQIIEDATERHTIHNKYPIFNLQIGQSINGLFGDEYKYTSFTFRMTKRFYMSQLGRGDLTLLAADIVGKVPFPLLNISPANQSLAYDPNAYNQMYYLEFVSDHYIGLNYNHNFNGFFLNKIPLVRRLKLREFMSLKILYGGLRNENNPYLTHGLYQLPIAGNGEHGTYYLQNTPYTEIGVGLGNIFKVLRVTAVKRFTYLDHPDVSQYGIKFDFDLQL